MHKGSYQVQYAKTNTIMHPNRNTDAETISNQITSAATTENSKVPFHDQSSNLKQYSKLKE
jgi:hypothetical protein